MSLNQWIDDEAFSALRVAFPRTAIPELLARIAGFPQVCWAGSFYFHKVINRSVRTIFRYFRKLKDLGIIERIPGDRNNPPNVRELEDPEQLRRQGYAITRFAGDFAPVMIQGVHRKRETWRVKGDRRREQKRVRRAERRQRRERIHAEFRQSDPVLMAKIQAAQAAQEARAAKHAKARATMQKGTSERVASPAPGASDTQGAGVPKGTTGPPD